MPNLPLEPQHFNALTWPCRGRLPRAQGVSIVLHASVIMLLLIPALAPFDLRPPAPRPYTVFSGSLAELEAIWKKASVRAQGGGGSGNHQPEPAGAGKRADFNMIPLAPPRRNLDDAALQVPPAIAGAPNTLAPDVRFLEFGDPFSKKPGDSQGPGRGGSFGDGDGNGQGPGRGDGTGPGNDWGYGGGDPRIGVAGRDAGMPVCAYCPNPTFSDEAIKVKYQGSVLLRLVVTADGRPTNLSILRTAGFGLDERAIEAVRTWRFQPARDRGGNVVAAWVNIEVSFRQF